MTGAAILVLLSVCRIFAPSYQQKTDSSWLQFYSSSHWKFVPKFQRFMNWLALTSCDVWHLWQGLSIYGSVFVLQTISIFFNCSLKKVSNLFFWKCVHHGRQLGEFETIREAKTYTGKESVTSFQWNQLRAG